jgi:hypothetical protein
MLDSISSHCAPGCFDVVCIADPAARLGFQQRREYLVKRINLARIHRESIGLWLKQCATSQLPSPGILEGSLHLLAALTLNPHAPSSTKVLMLSSLDVKTSPSWL